MSTSNRSGSHAPPAAHAANGPPTATPAIRRRRRRSHVGRFFLVCSSALAAAAAYTYTFGTDEPDKTAPAHVLCPESYVPTAAEPVAGIKPSEPEPTPPWDGFVRVKIDDAKAIGLLCTPSTPGRADQSAADGTHRLRPQHPLQDPPSI